MLATLLATLRSLRRRDTPAPAVAPLPCTRRLRRILNPPHHRRGASCGPSAPASASPTPQCTTADTPPAAAARKERACSVPEAASASMAALLMRATGRPRDAEGLYGVMVDAVGAVVSRWRGGGAPMLTRVC